MGVCVGASKCLRIRPGVKSHACLSGGKNNENNSRRRSRRWRCCLPHTKSRNTGSVSHGSSGSSMSLGKLIIMSVPRQADSRLASDMEQKLCGSKKCRKMLCCNIVVVKLLLLSLLLSLNWAVISFSSCCVCVSE